MSDPQRVAIVTGAAGGIGRAMIAGFLGAGIPVAAVDRDAAGLDALATIARHDGQTDAFFPIVADLADDRVAADIVARARQRFGEIDILVNNAGVAPGMIRPDSWVKPLKFWEMTPEHWRLYLAVHTTAPLALSRLVVEPMKARRWGRIVNVTTSLGTMIRPGFPGYGPSKAALEALSAVMAQDLDGSGVTVNVLVPGGVTNTGMIPENAGFGREQLIQPAVMAPPLLWLVSDAAGEVTARRFLAIHWDPGLPPREAAAKAGAP
ncbi:MAG TPA: SDR family oxidoreductase, partial [Stellaceae bacterium]|nr:SDR family oxidoreductase [Stellaceae bacterium]